MDDDNTVGFCAPNDARGLHGASERAEVGLSVRTSRTDLPPIRLTDELREPEVIEAALASLGATGGSSLVERVTDEIQAQGRDTGREGIGGMMAKRRKHHWLLALLVYGVIVWPGIDARGGDADDPELEVTARSLAEQITTLRKERDSSAMAEALQTFVRVHNALESKALRHELQHAVGKVLKDKMMGATRELAAEALGQIDDSAGGYNHLKRMLPSRKTEEATPLELAVLRSVGKLGGNSAITTLLELMAKAKDRVVSKEAISALGGYGESKRRVTILRELVSYMQRAQPHYTPGKRVSQTARERWNVLREPLLSALNRLTGQQLSSPEDWAALYRSNKRNLKILFSDE